MTDCSNAEISDSLPDLVHGRLGDVDTATLMAHVESCDACAAELALLRDVRASAPIAPRIDVASIVAAVPVRTTFVTPASAKSARGHRLTVGPTLWKLAAAAAIVTAGALVFNGSNPDRGPAPSRVASQPLPSTTAPAPDVAAEAPRVPSPGNASLSLVTGVQDLTDEEIETLLAELDGIDGIPSADPQPVPLSLDNLEVEG